MEEKEKSSKDKEAATPTKAGSRLGAARAGGMTTRTSMTMRSKLGTAGEGTKPGVGGLGTSRRPGLGGLASGRTSARPGAEKATDTSTTSTDTSGSATERTGRNSSASREKAGL